MLGIRLFLVGSFQNVVGRGMEIIGQTYQDFYGNLSLSTLVLRVGVLTDAEIGCQFPLCDVMIFTNVF